MLATYITSSYSAAMNLVVMTLFGKDTVVAMSVMLVL